MHKANHHAHTHFSDGQFEPERYVKEALDQNMEIYGFSDHAPIPNKYIGAMSLAGLQEYLNEIDRLKQKYQGQIQLYKSLEVDYIPGFINIHTDYIQAADLDYTIGAVHFVDFFPDGRPWGFQSSHKNFQLGVEKIFKGNIRACVHRYYELLREMIVEACPDVIAHLDRIKKLNGNNRYFNEDAPWYRAEVGYTLELIADNNAILEVNTKGYYTKETDETYPGKNILEIAKDLDISVHLASDAHHPADIRKGFDYAASVLREIGYTSCKVLNHGEWQELALSVPSLHSI